MINTGSGPGLAGNLDAYDRVSTYFGNIAIWLMPKRVRRCIRWPWLITLKELYPIAEFIIDLPDEPDLPTLLELGREMQFTMSRYITPGLRQELITDLFGLHSESLAQEVVLLRNEATNIEEQLAQKTAPLELLEQVALGAVTHAVATAMPSNGDLETSLK